ncbi:MAG TPA: NAD(P)/FAD-dependent oxidoreductase [Candidatus Limnocylindrales bacterium]|nr:NAD(P)/FAD-dependent oxidoreductase [Candidatus Limnocylindrales bacterium]
MTTPSSDVVIIGTGHNGLVAGVLLARAGLSVTMLEAAGVMGGATRTERPFSKVPNLQHSTGSYLLGLMPPELMRTLDIDIPVLRRDPHYFLPTPGSAYLLAGSQHIDNGIYSDADRSAEAAMQAELAMLREDLAPAWLRAPGSVEETAAEFIRPSLRSIFIDLVRGSVLDYLKRFDFESELLLAMYAVTDGISGLNAGPDDPGTGNNFLAHNMCRLPGSDGTWMIARGGMGSVSRILADKFRSLGGQILVDAPVASLSVAGGSVDGVYLEDGRFFGARVVLGACDPFELMRIADYHFPAELRERMQANKRTGTTMKVNLALSGLPTFKCLPPGTPSPFGSTIHLLPGSDGVEPLARLRRMWAQVQSGQLPDEPTIEWYLHTTVDPSLQDEAGHHSSALFVQSVPYGVELGSYVDHLLAICDSYAPGTSELVADSFTLTPQGIESHFGITGGHIHHMDNTISFNNRMPYATGLDGLYAGSAGCHPAGSVIGAAGHNAAQTILADMAR